LQVPEDDDIHFLIVEPPGTGKFNVPRWLFFTARASAFR